MADSVPFVYAFGHFRVEPHKRLLLRQGEAVPLTPKAFEVLLFLIGNRTREASKEELMRAVWPDTVVEENSLARNVSAVRKALGEKAGDHLYIVTVPGRGYRFVAPVEELSAEEPPAMWLVPAVARAPARRALTVWTAVLVASGGLVWALVRGRGLPSPGASRIGSRVVRLTTSGAAVRVAASPDGRHMAYVLRGRDGEGLWLADAQGTSEVPIVPPAPVEYWGLTFSPDGEFLYSVTFARNVTEPMLHRVAARGGAAVAVRPVSGGVTLSPDGSQLAYIDDSTRRGDSRLMIADAEGRGEARVLALLRHPERFLQPTAPAWSPQGDVIACAVAAQSDAHPRQLVTVRVRDGNRRRVGAHPWGKIESLAWRRDGTALLVTGGERGDAAHPLWEVSYPHGRAVAVTTDPSSYESVSAASSADLVLAVRKDERASVWVAPSAGQDQARAVLSMTGVGAFVEGVAWTPDRRIVHHTTVGGRQHLAIMEPDGSRRQLTVDGRNNVHPAVCGGGRYVVFASDRDGAMHVWRMETASGLAVRLTGGDGEAFPACAPDGEWVVYQQGYGHVKGTIWKVPLAGGGAVALTDEMAIRPAVSPDERDVAYFYMDAEVWGLAIAPLAGGPPSHKLAVPADAGMRFVRWTRDGRGLAYLVDRDGVSNVWVQPLDGGPARRASAFSSERMYAFDWSPDGSMFVALRGVTSADVVALGADGPR